MISFEFQKKLWGYGKGNLGYCVETWWCFCGFTIVHKKPNGIRGIVKVDFKELKK